MIKTKLHRKNWKKLQNSFRVTWTDDPEQDPQDLSQDLQDLSQEQGPQVIDPISRARVLSELKIGLSKVIEGVSAS